MSSYIPSSSPRRQAGFPARSFKSPRTIISDKKLYEKRMIRPIIKSYYEKSRLTFWLFEMDVIKLSALSLHFLSSDSSAGGASGKQQTQRKQELIQRLKELEIVNTITVSAASTLDIKSLLNLTGEKISKAFRHRSMLIALYDAQNHIILLVLPKLVGKCKIGYAWATKEIAHGTIIIA